MRTRVSRVALFAVSLAAACGYDPQLKGGGLSDGGGGATGIDAVGHDAGGSGGSAGGAGSGGIGVPAGGGGVSGSGGAGGTVGPDARSGGSDDSATVDAPITTGGISGLGGVAALGGTSGSGGSADASGAPGTDGTKAACQDTATQCSGDSSLQTCINGQWGEAVRCGTRQTCTTSAGRAQCTCTKDPDCPFVGDRCSSRSTFASCSQDALGCIYKASGATCVNGACSGADGSASCCTNACTVGTTCFSNTSLKTCVLGANGCTTVTTTTTCTNGACSGTAGSASCCTNACTGGTISCFSSTKLGACSIAANGCTAVSPTTSCPNEMVCERYGTASCGDPNWNEWPIPNSQVNVTAGAPNLESYTPNGDGTVTDNVTGLIWQQSVPLNVYTWSEAIAYCPTLQLAGHDDWRLPSLVELFSIVDDGQANPSINSTYFPSTPVNYFWSSSPMAGSATNAWSVDFYDSNPTVNGISNPYSVRCVR